MAVSFFGENEISYDDLLKLVQCESVHELPIIDYVGEKQIENQESKKDIKRYLAVEKYTERVCRCPNCKKESFEKDFKEISRNYSVYQCPQCKLYARNY